LFCKKPLPTEKTKDLILEEAKKQFCEKGYEGASVRDICLAVNANVSAIKYHFGGKEGLYRECFLHYGESRLSTATRILTTVNSVEELKLRMQLFAEDFIKEWIANPHTTKMICREIENKNPLIEDIFESTFLKVYTTLTGLIIEAQAKGLINKEIDHHAVTSIFFHSLTSVIRSDHIGEKYYQRTLRNPQYSEQFINSLISIIFNGIKNQEP
jgi:AcrR family transcriptional regulator